VEEERAIAMSRRLHRTARRTGLADAEADRLVDLFALVMDRRATTLSDPAHPEYLHPARTALILMDDAAVQEPVALQAAIIRDTVRTGLEPTAEALRGVADEMAFAAARRIPGADLDDFALLEALVVLEPDLLDAALAERLDHARHLHMGESAGWSEFHRQVSAVYLPASRRGNRRIAQRFGRWAEAFEWRFLRRLA